MISHFCLKRLFAHFSLSLWYQSMISHREIETSIMKSGSTYVTWVPLYGRMSRAWWKLIVMLKVEIHDKEVWYRASHVDVCHAQCAWWKLMAYGLTQLSLSNNLDVNIQCLSLFYMLIVTKWYLFCIIHSATTHQSHDEHTTFILRLIIPKHATLACHTKS